MVHVKVVGWDTTSGNVVSLPAGTNNVGLVTLAAGTAAAGTVVLGAGTALVGFITNTEYAGQFNYQGSSTAINYAAIAITTSVASIVVTSVAGKSIVVTSLWINANTLMSALFLNATTTAGGPLFVLTNGGGMVLPQNRDGWFKSGSQAQSFIITPSASGSLSGALTYILV